MADNLNEIRRGLTITEIGVIVSLGASVFTAGYTFAFLQAQVNQNSADIAKMEPEVDAIKQRLERIDANVTFLTQMAREEREDERSRR